MKNCSIVSDLLPLYVENLVSEDSKEFIENHIDTCNSCREELDNLKKDLDFKTDLNKRPLKFLNNNINKNKRNYGITIGLLVASLLLILMSFLTTPIHFESTEDLFFVEEYEDTVLVTFNERVTNYDILNFSGDKSGEYFLDGYTTRLDRILNSKKVQSHIFKKDETTSIFYDNHEKPFELIWGENVEGNGILLPRLALNMYLMAALGLFGVLSLLILIYKFILKKNLSIVNIAVILGLPFSYVLASFSIKGLRGDTHYLTRDLFYILILTMAYYLLLISISKIIKNKIGTKI